MFYVFLLVLAALGVGLYLLFIFQNVPGVVEERLGVLEPLPGDVGKWKTDLDSNAARDAAREGLEREVRTFFDEGTGKLLHQVRYRKRDTGEIVKSEPDRAIKRKRRKG